MMVLVLTRLTCAMLVSARTSCGSQLCVGGREAPGSPKWLGLGDPDGPDLIILASRSTDQAPGFLVTSVLLARLPALYDVTVNVSGSEAVWPVSSDLSCGVSAAVTARDRQE